MALTSAEKKKKQEELNRQGKLYLQAKAKGDKRAMAAARATADKIRKEAGWSYDAKTGTTYEKVSPIQKKGTVVNSKENLAMAKAGANPVKAVQQAAKKSSILTNSPASKSSVQQAKKAADTAAKKKAAPSTNKVLELGRGPIKTDGLTKSSVQKAVDAKRASTLNQMILGRAQTQGTLPKTSMLAKDQAGPFSAIPVADALRNLTQGPLQMQKLNDALDDLRKSKRINEENMGAPEQALRAAALGAAGGIGSLYETAKASVGNEIALLLQNPTRDLSEIGKLYQEQYGDATMDMDSWAARVMQESGRMRELATDDMGTVGKFLTDAGIGLAQNAPGIALSALNPVAGAVYFGANTAGSKAYEVQVNGGSADEALTRGIISGLIEGTTERISLHHLFNLAGNGTGAKQALKNFLRQMGVEASEEGTSYALNYLADKAAKDPNATFSVQELLWNMAVGGFTGGVMGAASGRVGSMARSVNTGMKNNIPQNWRQVSTTDSVHEALGDERFAQAESEISTKNNKSTDPLLLNRLQLPDSMADDTLIAYSIAQAGVRNNQTGDVLRRVTGIENPPETAAEIRAAEQSAQAGMQQSMEYMDAWNAEADRNTAQSTIPQAEMQADTQDTTGQESPGRVKAAAKDLYRNFISGQAELEAVAKAQKKINPNRANAEDLVQMSRTADATVDMIAAGHMVDRAGNRMGDSWNDLVGALTPEQSELLNLYRQHKHNIDRMSLKEKAAPGLETVRNELAALRAQYPGMATLTESQLQEIARTERGHLQATAREFLDVIERERQLAAVTDKPVLGRHEEGKSQTIPYTAEESRKIVQELEQAHPELKKQAEAIQRFHDDFMQEWAVGSGLMSQAQWQVLKDKYPDYVQTFRARDEWGNADITRRGRVDSMSPIRQAVGDISEIIPFEDAEMMQVNAIVKAARRNELFRNLYDFATEHPKQAAPFIRIKAQNSATLETMAGEYDSIIENVTQNAMRTENGSYQIIAMIDGKPVQMEVNAEIYAGLQNLYGQDRGASDAFGARIAKWVTNPFKQLTTGRNPLFFLSNFPKDFQTAYINTTSGRKTLAGYLWDVGGTVRSMAQNSSEWQTFQALGGKNSGFYHNEKGFRESAKTAEHRGVRRAVDMIGTPFEMVSENTEALWRFNEYRAAIRKYGDTQEGRAKAMQAAADVTTNFSRSAPMAKAAENYCAYLNASLQGLDKMARQLKNHPFLTTRRAAEIIALPTILLYMLNKDDEDYQHLNDRTKDNYYCIPTGKGTFIKIPKSREYGVAMGALLERFMRLRDGEDPETALDGIGGQFLTNIAPSNPFTDNIAKTIFIDLPTNQDFAGRSIIPERLANLSPENQYDYTTSKAGIAASKAWNATLGRLFPKMAPIQADYLIDSNLGFVGDMILGSTQQGSKSVKDVLKAVIAEPVVRKLTADPLYQNGVTDAFYKELSKAETAANDKNLTEGLESRVVTPEEKYLSALKKSSSEISELRKQEREILSDTTISKQEQEAQTREIRREINRIALGAKAQAEQERDAWAKTYVPEISHLTDEKQKEARAAYEQNGTPYTDFVRYDDRYRLLQKDKETSSAADRAKLAGYLESDDTLTDEQKEGLYEHLLIPYLSDSRKEDWDKTYKSKVAPSLFFEIANEYSQIGDELDDLEKGKAQAKATAFSMYLDGMGLSDDVRGQVENDFKYFNMNPAKSENYTFEMMRKNGGKNEQAYAGALEQSGLSIERYYEIKDMKNAKDADGSYTYKKDDIVQEMRDKGFTTAQIGAVCGAFGWKAPSSSGSSKSSSSSKSTSSSGSTGNTLRRLTGLPKLPKIG